MKTAEALKIAGAVAGRARYRQQSAAEGVARNKGRNCACLRGQFARSEKIHREDADALDQLRADHALLRSELTKVRGMLAYVLDGLRADRVDLDGGHKDVRHMKQQLKVAAHILKITKP